MACNSDTELFEIYIRKNYRHFTILNVMHNYHKYYAIDKEITR